MITINLLPEAYRKPKITSLQKFHRSPLALSIVAILIGVVVLLLVFAQVRQAHLTQLTTRLQQLAPQKASVDALTASVQTLRDQEAVFTRLGRERSQWAKRLNLLSDVTPQGVWFTDLSFDQQKGLVIQGSAIGQGGEEMVSVGRLVQDLKVNAAFSSLVQEIQIESIKTVQEKDIEVIEFTLTGKLIPSPAVTKP